MIEPLESRIAPAAVVPVGNHPLPSYSSKYISPKTGQVLLQFINAASMGLSPADQEIASTVGDSSNVYFIKINAGAGIEIPDPVGYQSLVNVTHGTVVAFFTDLNADGVVDAQELTGLALGTKTSVAIGVDVNGDVLTNYNDATGFIGASDPTHLLPNTVTSLAVTGSITGDFVSGGAVAHFQAKNVGAILTGTAANGYQFSFDSHAASPTLSTLNVPMPSAGVAGPSLSNLNISSVNAITLGAGGPGAVGGSINGLIVQSYGSSLTVTTGAGGAGIAGKTAGGAGGSVSNVLVQGVSIANTDVPAIAGYSNPLLTLIGGAGGAGFGSGKGGAGGAVQNVFIGYDAANLNAPSVGLDQTDVLIQGGVGGTGGSAGAGGSLTNVNVLAYTFHDPNVTTPEFQLLGGAGGASSFAGHGGVGGSINHSVVEDKALPAVLNGLADDSGATTVTPTDVQILVQAGAGGAETLSGAGSAGGSVTGMTLEGYNFHIVSGKGGDGIASGGTGGSVSSVSVLGSSGALPGDDFHAQSVIVTTGGGGNATAGKGGAGGALSSLNVQNADFNSTGLQIVTGAGGHAGKGKGGSGGSLSQVNITAQDFDTVTQPNGSNGTAVITTGNGGAAPVAGGTGGSGGSISSVTVVGTRLAVPTISAGSGGAGGASGSLGKGGIGGTITNVAIRTAEGEYESTTTANPGILQDYFANFSAVQQGDQVENTLTGAYTTVTKVVSATQLDLASDIFAAGDPYLLVTEQTSGTAEDTQDTIIDANANFVAEGIHVGSIVEDLNDVALNGTYATAVVTSVDSPTQLTVTQDISHVGDQYDFTSFGIATFTAGSGGAGSLGGAGGAGGSIVNSSAVVPGTISFTGGQGGDGGSAGANGAGGSLISPGAISSTGSGYLLAGSAGSLGAKAGAGGRIDRADVQVLTDVSLIAGDGFSGGAGGNITSSGYSGVLQDGGGFNPPAGNIMVHAGAGGSSLGGNGGAGGSISSVTGFVSSGNTYSYSPTATQFIAGAGGDGMAKAGAGGSVNDVRFFGGGNFGVTLSIDAGDAGNASTGKTGAPGGNVSNIGGGVKASGSYDINFSIDPYTDFHHVSAGNGGDALIKGGLGGSVTNVHVNAAIGQRTGANFGFDPNGAGGISAGAGGLAATPGLAGNVTNITADAIASIVAGHLSEGDPLVKANLVTNVSGIILNGTVAPSVVQQFELSFNGETIPVTLPTNATTSQVAQALNQLASIQQAGGVSVAKGANGYVVTFNVAGAGYNSTLGTANPQTPGNTTAPPNTIIADEPAPIYGSEITLGDATHAEVQNAQVFPQDAFSLSFGGYTTPQLPAGDSASDVATNLNNLPSITAAGGVTVTYSPGTTGAYSTNPSYTITFNTPGAQSSVVVPNFAFTEASTGTDATLDAQSLIFPIRGDLTPSQIASANMVGSIANLLQPSATTFHYTEGLNANPTAPFHFGDSPVDGLIAAVNLLASKNFIPEAFVTIDASGNAAIADAITT